MEANQIKASTQQTQKTAAGPARIAIRPIIQEPIRVTPSSVPIAVRPSAAIRILPATQKSPLAVRPQRLIAVVPAEIRPQAIHSIPAVQVGPPKRGAWAERGWIARNEGRNEVYEGNYQARTRRFPGRIQVEGRSRRITAFIHDPPREIKRHRKGPCFQQYGIGTGWFMLHWRTPAQNVDDAILYMERILDESLSR